MPEATLKWRPICDPIWENEMHFRTLAVFSNGTEKRSKPFENHFKTFGKRFQTLMVHFNETLFRYIGKHLQNIA